MLYFVKNVDLVITNFQAEGSEVSAELEFLNQQSLILSMENKALKQRLENLAQEQMIKYCKSLLYLLYFIAVPSIYNAWIGVTKLNMQLI